MFYALSSLVSIQAPLGAHRVRPLAGPMAGSAIQSPRRGIWIASRRKERRWIETERATGAGGPRGPRVPGLIDGLRAGIDVRLLEPSVGVGLRIRACPVGQRDAWSGLRLSGG